MKSCHAHTAAMLGLASLVLLFGCSAPPDGESSSAAEQAVTTTVVIKAKSFGNWTNAGVRTSGSYLTGVVGGVQHIGYYVFDLTPVADAGGSPGDRGADAAADAPGGSESGAPAVTPDGSALPPPHDSTQFSLDTGWQFIKQDVGGAQAVGFDDSAWTTVSTPIPTTTSTRTGCSPTTPAAILVRTRGPLGTESTSSSPRSIRTAKSSWSWNASGKRLSSTSTERRLACARTA